MRIKGIRCNRVKHIGWRRANPETDVDIDGNPLDSSYFVLVKISDCELTEDSRGRKFYNADNVPQWKSLAYGGTYYGYDKTRQQNRGRYIDGKWVDKYWTTGFWAVINGLVYRGTIHHKRPNARWYHQNGWSWDKNREDWVQRGRTWHETEGIEKE